MNPGIPESTTAARLANLVKRQYRDWDVTIVDLFKFFKTLFEREVTLYELRYSWTPKRKWTKSMIMTAINPIIQEHGYGITSKGKGFATTSFSLKKL